MVARSASYRIQHRGWGAMGSVYLYVHAARTWTEGTGVKYTQRGTKGKKSKTSSGPWRRLQQERKECSVLYNRAGFNTICFVGGIVFVVKVTISNPIFTKGELHESVDTQTTAAS